jgi:hypothetical protein
MLTSSRRTAATLSASTRWSGMSPSSVSPSASPSTKRGANGKNNVAVVKPSDRIAAIVSSFKVPYLIHVLYNNTILLLTNIIITRINSFSTQDRVRNSSSTSAQPRVQNRKRVAVVSSFKLSRPISVLIYYHIIIHKQPMPPEPVMSYLFL